MDWKAFWKRLIFPPVRIIVLLSLLSAVALPVVFIKDLTQTPVAYIVYVTAFYTVCVTSVFGAVVLPERYKRIRKKVYDHPLGHRYMTDAAFKTHISLYVSLTVNLLYALVNGIGWYVYHSMWFVVLAVYYTILSVMRFLLVRYVRTQELGKNRLGECRRARTCAWILLLLNFVLTGAVMMILYQNKGFEYRGVLIYVAAGYTFYITIHAAVDLVRYRKYHSPVMTASKVVALSAALVSMLALETAMLSQFGGDMAPENKWIIVTLTGAGVSIAVIALSVYMIVMAAREIKEIEKDGREEPNI